MHLKNEKLYNERGITFFHETERYVNHLNIYNRSKNGTNLWDDLIYKPSQNQLSRYSVLTFLTVTLLDSHNKLYQYI